MSKKELLKKAEQVAREALAENGHPDEKTVKKVAAKMVKAMPERALQAV
jgi:hypothetical protein